MNKIEYSIPIFFLFTRIIFLFIKKIGIEIKSIPIKSHINILLKCYTYSKSWKRNKSYTMCKRISEISKMTYKEKGRTGQLAPIFVNISILNPISPDI